MDTQHSPEASQEKRNEGHAVSSGSSRDPADAIAKNIAKKKSTLLLDLSLLRDTEARS